MECDADIRKNPYAIFFTPSGGTATFQETVERVTKEPTVLAPSTVVFPVAVSRLPKVSLWSTEIGGFFPFHKCEQNFEVPKTRQVCTLSCCCKEC